MSGLTRLRSLPPGEETLPIQVTAGSSLYEGTEIVRAHGYEDHQLTLCIAGSGYFLHAGERHAIVPATLFHFRQGVPHAYGPDAPGWMLKWVCFNGKGAVAILDHLGYGQAGVVPHAGSELAGLFDPLVTLLDRDEPFRASWLLQQLLADALPPSGQTQARQQLERVVALIRERHADCLTLEDLSTAHGCSPSYLCRAFRNAYGTTPVEYLNRHRIAMASAMLLDSRKSIQDIAAACGFVHPDYFCTAFRRQKGCSPSAFRERYGMSPARRRA
jgi:AraC family transcriptional regulator, arabinose operon regulatory protein